MTDEKFKVSKAPPPITPVRGGGYGAKRAVEVQRKPATAPDWAYWPAARPVKPWQAVALSLNLGPESLKHSSTAWMAGPGAGPILESESFPDAETEATFRKRLALLGDFVSHSSKAPLGVIAGKLVAHTMPSEMAALIAVPTVTVESAETTDNFTPAKVEAVKGITKQLVINAFEGMHFDRDHWGKNLATPPNWLIDCRVAKGNKKTSATWNPVLIAMALTDPKRGISVNKLDVVFVGLKDWAAEWREASDYLR